MREKYESLGLADLKAIAKARGLKGTSTMKKADLVELMLAEDEKDKAQLIVAEEMQNAAKLRVPLVVDTGVGNSWYDAK